jgi:hypothetical protein
MPPAVLIGRCSPYGAETGGPRHVLGGLYGPNSARTPDMHLPASVEQGEWPCTRPAEVRCRMECACGHTGQIMQLCSWHDEETWHADRVAGSFRRERGIIKVRGHFEEIQRRQAGACPKCMWPGPFAALHKETDRLAYDLALEYASNGGSLRTPRALAIIQKSEGIGARFDAARVQRCPWCSEWAYVEELRADAPACGQGRHRPVDLTRAIHNCALTLRAVS